MNGVIHTHEQDPFLVWTADVVVFSAITITGNLGHSLHLSAHGGSSVDDSWANSGAGNQPHPHILALQTETVANSIIRVGTTIVFVSHMLVVAL
jgi:hypothetical protein